LVKFDDGTIPYPTEPFDDYPGTPHETHNKKELGKK